MIGEAAELQSLKAQLLGSGSLDNARAILNLKLSRNVYTRDCLERVYMHYTWRIVCYLFYMASEVAVAYTVAFSS